MAQLNSLGSNFFDAYADGNLMVSAREKSDDIAVQGAESEDRGLALFANVKAHTQAIMVLLSSFCMATEYIYYINARKG